MSKLYLFMSHFDSYEPIHSITNCRKQLYTTKEEATDRFKKESMDFGVVFEIDTETLPIEVCVGF